MSKRFQVFVVAALFLFSLALGTYAHGVQCAQDPQAPNSALKAGPIPDAEPGYKLFVGVTSRMSNDVADALAKSIKEEAKKNGAVLVDKVADDEAVVSIRILTQPVDKDTAYIAVSILVHEKDSGTGKFGTYIGGGLFKLSLKEETENAANIAGATYGTLEFAKAQLDFYHEERVKLTQPQPSPPTN